ncbi:MAG: phenylalanine--tRNA ligase subunit beta [Saprospiraceae bacterium]
MKLSLSWVSQYITLEYTPEEIAEMLTTIGLEVEGWEKVESVKGGLQGIVVGHVTYCEKHPDADKLSLTQVNIGHETNLQIVCGAPNVQKGQKVLVATIGTTLYDKEGSPWKIKKGKIRGQESEGMICAQDELGLGEDHSGIMVLSPDAPIGESAASYLKMEEDVVFEIGLTPNRSDATAHLGVAKDLLAYLKVNKNYDGEILLPETKEFITEKIKQNIEVEVLNKHACARYSGITIAGVQITDSPDWIKKSLLSLGIKPINNIVDITNYVLHEMGQPLHAFDADKINGNKIIVDTLPEETPFTTLDNVSRKLRDADLMICDGEKNPLCMAGIYGGIHSGVTATTTNIFLESAYFNPSYIRTSSTSHNLRTEAAKIFEKGADPNMTIFALKRAAGLIKASGGGSISNDMIDVYPHKLDGKEIKIRYSKVNEVIGVNIEKEKIQFILTSLDMKIRTFDEDSILVYPGTNKHDVTREIDVIEEILRIYGLNNVPISSGIKSTISYTLKPDKNEIKEIVSQFLSTNHFHEMMGLSLIESKQLSDIDALNPKSFVYINNTSNIHLDILRPDLLTSGLQTIAYNLNRQQSNLKLYEHGKSYTKNENGFEEKEYLTIFLTGKNLEETWYAQGKNEISFYDIKHVSISIMKRLGLVSWQEDDKPRHFGLKYGMTFHRADKPFIIFGAISSVLLKKFGIKQEVFFAQIELLNVVKALAKNKFTVREISKFPSTRRDLAIILNDNVLFDEVLNLAKKVDKTILKDVRLFDIFKDKIKVGEGKKSYAVSFHFENTERTLSDKEVDVIMAKIIISMENQLQANIRK